jgi:hypothetical protein
MATNRPDPGDFLEMAQRMLRELFEPRGEDDDPRGGDDLWGDATRRWRESFSRERTEAPRRTETPRRHREPSADEQRENLTFALATRAVEALEDLALNVAAIRQRLERTGPTPKGTNPETDGRRPDVGDATEE